MSIYTRIRVRIHRKILDFVYFKFVGFVLFSLSQFLGLTS